MTVRLRLFAALREIVGRDEMDLELPAGTTAGGLWERLVADYPKLIPYAATIQVAINQDFADRRTELRERDDVAFLPPVSGG